MGYLSDTWRDYDAKLAQAGWEQGKRNCLQVTFYLGVKAMFDAAENSHDMKDAEGTQFLLAILEELNAFARKSEAEAVATIVGRVLAAMESKK